MQILKINVLDGRGLIEVAVHDVSEHARLREFVQWATKLGDKLEEAQQQIENFKEKSSELL